MERIANDDMLQEIFVRALDVALISGAEAKRRRAAYVLGDAITGRVDGESPRASQRRRIFRENETRTRLVSMAMKKSPLVAR